MYVKNFKELIVWQKSMILVKEIYKVTKQFPKSEVYGLSSQMQRASVAIPSNISEGYRRNHTGEYRQFLGIALGSAAELETQILVSEQLYTEFDYKVLRNLVEEVEKMLFAMIRNLKR